MNMNQLILHSSIALAVCLGALPHSAVRADESDSAAIPAPGDVLGGKLQAVSEQLDATIDNLEAVRLKEFVRSYRDLATAYVTAAEEIQSAFQSASHALARIQFTRRVIAATGDSPADCPTCEQHSLTGVRKLRAALLDDLDNARDDFAAAQSADEGRRHLGRISLAVERIEQIDALLGAHESKLPEPKLSDLSGPLSALEAEIETEQRQLEVQAVTLSGLLTDAMAQVDQSLQILEIGSTLPYERLKQLQQVRSGVRQLVDRIRNTRGAASAMVREVLDRRPLRTVADSEQLLEQARSLLEATSTGLAE